MNQNYQKILWRRFCMWWEYVELRMQWYGFSLNSILLCICLFIYPPYHESKVPTGSASTNLGLIDKIYISKIALSYLKAEGMRDIILSAIFIISWYIHILGSYKLNSLSSRCLSIWICPDEGLGVYPIWPKYTLFLPTEDGSASILGPKQSMNFLYSIILTVKIGPGFPLFRKTILEVREKTPCSNRIKP